jgi:hypothetical protein
MPVRGTHKTFAVAAVLALGLALLGAWAWLRSQYVAQEQIELAERFVELLRSQRLAEAYELTMKTRMELPTKEDFAEFAPRQICGAFKLVEVFPFQSNGNRLRRRITGREVEIPELDIQYMGECAFRVTIRRDAAQKLKVYKFGSHAY